MQDTYIPGFFVFQSQCILALVIYKWPYCLLKAGVSIIEGRGDPSRILPPETQCSALLMALGIPARRE